MENGPPRLRRLPFSLDGYLIGQILAISRPLLLVNADSLKTKAEKDALPGYDAAKLAAIATDRPRHPRRSGPTWRLGGTGRKARTPRSSGTEP